MSLKLVACFAIALIPALLTMPGMAAADDDAFKVTAAVTIPTNATLTSFDISYVDPALGIYVLGDRTNNAIDVVDTKSLDVFQLGKGHFVGVKTNAQCATGNGNDCSGPDGVVIVNQKEIWVGDGDSTFKIISLASHAVSPGISTGGKFRVDEMCFDPVDQIVMMANNADDPPFATFVSTQPGNAILGKVEFKNSTNGAEQCQWNPRTGKFYIAIPEIDHVQGGVVVINPHNLKIEKTFSIPVTDCKNPQGMAIGPKPQILLGCNGDTSQHSTVVINELNGQIIQTFANESGADMVWFNPGNNHYFLARSSAFGNTQKLGIIDAVSLSPDADISVGPTGAPNAHSVAADPVTNRTFFPIPGGKSMLCGSVPGGSNALGCIAVITGTQDGDDCVAEGAPVISAGREDDPLFHKVKCQ